MVYRESGFGTYAEGSFGTLKACGGNNGGGERESDRAERSRRQQYEH